jgi:hypothetical protein
MKAKAYVESGKRSPFSDLYTRDSEGFYVRNEKPSSGTMNRKRIEENVRSLVNDAAAKIPETKEE